MTLDKHKKAGLPEAKPLKPATVICNYFGALGLLHTAPSRYTQFIDFNIQFLENKLANRPKSSSKSSTGELNIFLHAPVFDQ